MLWSQRRWPQAEDRKGYGSDDPSSAHTCEGGTQAVTVAKVLEMSVPILPYKDQHPAEVERAQTLKTARPRFKPFTGYMILDKGTHLSEPQFPKW